MQSKSDKVRQSTTKSMQKESKKVSQSTIKKTEKRSMKSREKESQKLGQISMKEIGFLHTRMKSKMVQTMFAKAATEFFSRGVSKS